MCGLIGSFVLSAATALKIVRALLGGRADGTPWHELPLLALQVAGMGFVCGVVLWAVRWLPARLGRPGDALAGAIVLAVFYAMCMTLFAPHAWGGGDALLMLAMGAGIGAIGGLWTGHDLRRSAQREDR
jgi:hypothetical protein